MKLSERRLKRFFFEAARKTYAGQSARETIEQLPGSKVYTYNSNFEGTDFLYKDVYYANGLRSGGQTTIFARDDRSCSFEPVWLMQYNGFEKHQGGLTIPLLKSALINAYEQEMFYGGRGPYLFGSKEAGLTAMDQLWYINESSGGFSNFSGEEKITLNQNLQGEQFLTFKHIYSGRALIDLD